MLSGLEGSEGDPLTARNLEYVPRGQRFRTASVLPGVKR